VSAPERREPQSEAARDSRPPRCVSPPSTLVPHPIVRSPPRVIPDFSNPSTQHHQHHDQPWGERLRSLSLPVSVFLTLAEIRLSGPSHDPYPRPLYRPESQPSPPLVYHPSSSTFSHRLLSLRVHPSLRPLGRAPTSAYYFCAWQCACTTVPISIRSYR